MIIQGANRRGVISLLMLGLAVVPLLGCGLVSSGLPVYRYRLTVEVDTPEGLKTGSSVIEVHSAIAGRNSIPTPGAFSHRAQGEAVAVDLGARGVLFALLSSDDNPDWASGVMFGFAPGTGDNTEVRFREMLKNRNLIELPKRFKGSMYVKGNLARPTLVTFVNTSDPTTISKVNPDDLTTSFGPGVKLRRMTVRFTDDPVTTGIEHRLTWLPNTYERLHGTNFHPDGIPVGDFQHMFSTEEFK